MEPQEWESQEWLIDNSLTIRGHVTFPTLFHLQVFVEWPIAVILPTLGQRSRRKGPQGVLAWLGISAISGRLGLMRLCADTKWGVEGRVQLLVSLNL